MVNAHDLSSTNLLVKWSHLPKADFQGQPIGYFLTHHPDSKESEINSISLNYTTNSTTLTNLTVYTMYVINVSAVSSGGIGPAKTVRAQTGAEGKEVLKWTWVWETVLLLKRSFMEGRNTKNSLLVISYLLGAHEAIYFLVIIFGIVEILMWTSLGNIFFYLTNGALFLECVLSFAVIEFSCGI